MKNEYAVRQKAAQQAVFVAGMALGFQQAMDYVQCALHDPEVMGRDTLGRERIDKVSTGVMKRDEKYSIAYTTQDEADYYQELLDRELRAIYGEDLVPFDKRHPYLKKYIYGRKK